jgi:hypothetical protein
VEEKLKNTEKKNNDAVCTQLRNFKVLDPCCGCGTFIIAYLEIIETYLDSLKYSPDKKSEIIDYIIKHSIYAFDLNMDAINILNNRLLFFYYKVLLKCSNIFEKKSLFSYVLASHILKRNPLILYEENRHDIAMILQKERYTLRITRDLIYNPEFLTRFKTIMQKKDNGIQIADINNDSEIDFSIDKKSFDPIDYLLNNHIDSVLVSFKLSPSNLSILYPLKMSDIPSQFDIIFGNPPYIRADNQDPEFKSQRNLIKLLYSADPDLSANLKMKWDLYIAFLTVCVRRLLKTEGCLGFIISESFGYSEFSEPIRKLLLPDYNIIDWVHFEKI